MSNYIKAIIAYIIKPVYLSEKFDLKDKPFQRFAYTYLLAILGLFASSILLAILSSITTNYFGFNLLEELRAKKFVLHHSEQIKILLFVLVGPVLEELMFRLILIPTRLNVALPLGLMFFLHVSPLVTALVFKDGFVFRLVCAVLSLLLTILIYFRISDVLIANLQGKYFKYLFYLSCLAFGFMHISNFQPLSKSIIILSPFIVMPQLIYGLLIGYLRINFKYGFFVGLLFHVLINLPGRFS